MLAGFVEQAHISEFQFENQRRTFTSYGTISFFLFSWWCSCNTPHQINTFVLLPDQILINCLS